MEKYQRAKFNIFMKQTADDYIVYNADDEIVVTAITQAKSQVIPFSTKRRMIDGAWADEIGIYFKNEEIIAKKDIVLVGTHNLENILAAVCAAKVSGATNEGIRKV